MLPYYALRIKYVAVIKKILLPKRSRRSIK